MVNLDEDKIKRIIELSTEYNIPEAKILKMVYTYPDILYGDNLKQVMDLAKKTNYKAPEPKLMKSILDRMNKKHTWKEAHV
jgi:hypothetical protein|tara:strand:- start:74 stop:316 length:243 start_codon:yes stop_codon:yes gene_type:complete